VQTPVSLGRPSRGRRPWLASGSPRLEYRGDREAGLRTPRVRVLVFANLETHRVVGSQAAAAAQLGLALWHELGCDAGADDVAKEALADRLTRADQQASRHCRSRDRAGAKSSPRTSSQLDESRQRSRSRRRDDRFAGIATASPSTRLLAQRSAANSMALAHRAVRADPANEGRLPPWTNRSSVGRRARRLTRVFSSSSRGEARPGELPVVCRRPPVMPSAQIVDHRAGATTRSTGLVQPWRCNHADAGTLTIAFDERALPCLRGSSKRRRILRRSAEVDRGGC
jgi:hypothetical protein